MSEKKSAYPTMPSAPLNMGIASVPEFNHRGQPPPSYAESQSPAYRPPPSYYAPHTHQAPPIYAGTAGYPMQTGMYPQASVAYNNYQVPVVGNTVYQVQQGCEKTVEFDHGARFNGRGGGSISVPPPPPGYAATPAQKAALQGQPVMLKKKKNSFF